MSTPDARSRIIDAATRVFGERGVASTRVEDLLQSAGVSRRTFYKHFKGKGPLLEALYEALTAELLSRVVLAASAADDPLHGIEVALDAYLEVHLTEPRLVRVLVESALRSDSPLAPMRHRFRAQLVAAIDAVATQEAGTRVDPWVWLALVSALEGLSLELLREERSAADVQRAREVALGLLRAAIDAAPQLPAARGH